MLPTLHLLGLPHTITTDEFSHCAFTGKVKKFSPMMRRFGYRVVHYGIEGADSGANEQIDVLTKQEFFKYLGHNFSDKTRFHGTDANVGYPIYTHFNRKLRQILASTVNKNDLVICPFGHGHQAGVDKHDGINVESGIGYPTTFSNFRIYESYAWMHRLQGVGGREGNNYEWVVPNYYISEDWPLLEHNNNSYNLFFGRIGDTKGCNTIVEIAKRLPNESFILCGQGDPTPYIGKNVHYLKPVVGKDRATLLRNAKCLLMPSNFVEPFGGAAVEAMMCGTPVIGVTYGAFTETIIQGVNGFRCRVLNDWIEAIESAPELNRARISSIAQIYDISSIGKKYDAIFKQIYNLHNGGGWYDEVSNLSIN